MCGIITPLNLIKKFESGVCLRKFHLHLDKREKRNLRSTNKLFISEEKNLLRRFFHLSETKIKFKIVFRKICATKTFSSQKMLTNVQVVYHCFFPETGPAMTDRRNFILHKGEKGRLASSQTPTLPYPKQLPTVTPVTT